MARKARKKSAAKGKKKPAAVKKKKRKTAAKKKTTRKAKSKAKPKRKGVIAKIVGAAGAVVDTLADAERLHHKLEPHVSPDPE